MNDGFIYFIKAGDFVKIGYSKNPHSRINQIQTDNPIAVKLLGVIEGNVKKEEAIQQKFSKYLVRGEWFSFCSEIVEYVERYTVRYASSIRKKYQTKKQITVYLQEENIEYLKFLSQNRGIGMSISVNIFVAEQKNKVNGGKNASTNDSLFGR